MTPCPDHEALAGFIERRLLEPELGEVERHLATCPSCLDVVAAAAPASDSDDAVVDEHENASVPSRRSEPHAAPARRWWPQAMAAGLVLLLTGSIGYLAAGAAAEQARVALARIATARLGVTVDMEAVQLSLSSDLRSIGIRMLALDLGSVGNADGAELMFSLGSLARGTLDLRGIRLFAPEFRWDPSANDPAHPHLGDALGALALVPTVELIDAVLQVNRSTGPPILIERLSGTAHAIGQRVHLRATGRLAGGALGLRGTLDIGQQPHLALSIGGRDIPSASLPYLQDWAAGRAAVTLRITGDTHGLRWAGRVHVADARLHGISVHRDMSAALRIDPSALAPNAGETTDLRATFRIDQAGWRVPRSLVVRGDLETRATLRGADPTRLRGEGVLRLSAARARPLITRHPLIALYGTPSGGLALPFRLQGVPGRVRVVPRQ